MVGSPTVDDLSSACETARQHVLRRAHHQPDPTILYSLSGDCNHEVVHLLCQMLVFNPVSVTVNHSRDCLYGTYFVEFCIAVVVLFVHRYTCMADTLVPRRH